jgi:hypothetical protein
MASCDHRDKRKFFLTPATLLPLDDGAHLLGASLAATGPAAVGGSERLHEVDWASWADGTSPGPRLPDRYRLGPDHRCAAPGRGEHSDVDLVPVGAENAVRAV